MNDDGSGTYEITAEPGAAVAAQRGHMDADRKFVEDHWDGVSIVEQPMGWFVYAAWGEDAEVLCLAGYCATESEAIEQAKAFTEARLKQIADVEEKIVLLRRLNNEQDLNATEQVTMARLTFEQIHEIGARTHPDSWFIANRVAVQNLWDSDLRVADEEVKRVVSLIVLRILDVMEPRKAK